MKRTISTSLVMIFPFVFLFAGCGKETPPVTEEITPVSAEIYQNDNPEPLPESEGYAGKALEAIENVIAELNSSPDTICFTDFDLDGTLELVADYGTEARVFRWDSNEYTLLSDTYAAPENLSLYYNNAAQEYVFVVTETGEDGLETTISEQTFDGESFRNTTVFHLTTNTDENGEMHGRGFLGDGTEFDDIEVFNEMFAAYFGGLTDAKISTYKIAGETFAALDSEGKIAELQKSYSSFGYSQF